MNGQTQERADMHNLQQEENMPKGVRLNPEHDERTRAKIRTSQIINRLEKLVNGEIEMTAQQVRAADILLKKTLPDLASVEHTGDTASLLTLPESADEIIRRCLNKRIREDGYVKSEEDTP